MNKLETFERFLSTQSPHLPVWGFLINLLLTAILAYILSIVYERYGNSLSNRRQFAKNFILLSITTMMIISVVKSSLALSLGLVGALSIVRFRAAIKEPEELTYLFLCISIGLGIGADQILITLLTIAFVCLFMWIRHFFIRHEEGQNLLLTIQRSNPGKLELPDVVEILKKHCESVNLRRFDEGEHVQEASFIVSFNSISELQDMKEAITADNKSTTITFLDNKGII